MLQIRFLDYVAIKVRDMERSAQWYEQVFGLKRYTFQAWGDFPILMLAGKSRIALFPTQTASSQALPKGIGSG